MNTLLKILGVCFLAIIALKLAPLLFGFVGVLVTTAIGATMLLVGAGAVAGIAAVSAVVALAPIWIPLALLIGCVALICRMTRSTA